MRSFLAFSSHSFYKKNSSLFSDLISLVLSLFYLAPKFHGFYKHSINKRLTGVLLFDQYLNKLQGWKLFKQTCDIHFMLFTFQAFLGITTLILIWEVKKNFVSLLGRKSFNLRYGEGFRKGVTCPNYFLCSMPLRVGGGDKRFFREPEVCFSDFAVQLIDISSYHTRIHLYMTSTTETSNKCVTIHTIKISHH